MKIRKAMVWIGTVISLTVMAGCGDSASLNEQSVQEQDTEHEEGNTNKVSGQEEESSIKSEDDSKQALSNDPDDDTQKETEVLTGSVKSIGADSIVLSQAFEKGGDTLVQPAEGSSDEVCIDVFVSETTQYEIHTVKNGGVNGDADVETREGSFSDLEEGASVTISGYEEESRFQAEKILIYLFI